MTLIEGSKLNPGKTDTLMTDFFLQDDIKKLAVDTGTMLNCPLLVLDAAFHILAYYITPGFSDCLFDEAVRHGEITYEAGAVISGSCKLSAGRADYIKLSGSIYRRRFAPLVSAGVRLGYLICVDTDGNLQKVSDAVWNTVELVLAKQMFVETGRRDRPFETAEDILIHLLDGGFDTATHFYLQTADTYLADFHPKAFALIDLTAYHSLYLGKRYLKEEIVERFPDSHPFLYKGDVFMFLHSAGQRDAFLALAEEFNIKVIVSEPINDMYEIPRLYRAAHNALTLILDGRFHGGNVYTVSQLRTPLMLKSLTERKELIPPKLSILAEHDRNKGTQYCETLYRYLTCDRSLKKTSDMLFTHRNTVLYRIRRIREDFCIEVDEPDRHIELLLGTAMVLFDIKGTDFFLTKEE